MRHSSVQFTVKGRAETHQEEKYKITFQKKLPDYTMCIIGSYGIAYLISTGGHFLEKKSSLENGAG
jgi:hypothetical protein